MWAVSLVIAYDHFITHKGIVILNSQVLLPLQTVKRRGWKLCAAMDTLIDQDGESQKFGRFMTLGLRHSGSCVTTFSKLLNHERYRPVARLFCRGGGGGGEVKSVKFWDLLWLRVDYLAIALNLAILGGVSWPPPGYGPVRPHTVSVSLVTACGHLNLPRFVWAKILVLFIAPI